MPPYSSIPAPGLGRSSGILAGFSGGLEGLTNFLMFLEKRRQWQTEMRHKEEEQRLTREQQASDAEFRKQQGKYYEDLGVRARESAGKELIESLSPEITYPASVLAGARELAPAWATAHLEEAPLRDRAGIQDILSRSIGPFTKPTAPLASVPEILSSLSKATQAGRVLPQAPSPPPVVERPFDAEQFIRQYQRTSEVPGQVRLRAAPRESLGTLADIRGDVARDVAGERGETARVIAQARIAESARQFMLRDSNAKELLAIQRDRASAYRAGVTQAGRQGDRALDLRQQGLMTQAATAFMNASRIPYDLAYKAIQAEVDASAMGVAMPPGITAPSVMGGDLSTALANALANLTRGMAGPGAPPPPSAPLVPPPNLPDTTQWYIDNLEHVIRITYGGDGEQALDAFLRDPSLKVKDVGRIARHLRDRAQARQPRQ